MIKVGKITDINSDYKEWFLGPFINDLDLNTAEAKKFEVKWSKKEKGFTFPLKNTVVEDTSCKSMVVLIQGKFKYCFLNEQGLFGEYVMTNGGDFIFWTPDINHKIEALEDSLVLTIRWYE